MIADVEERLEQIDRVYEEGYAYFWAPHWDQLPIWVSADAARLVRWAREQPVSRRAGTLTPRFRSPGFTVMEAIAFFFGESVIETAGEREEWVRRSAYVDSVIYELRRSNVIGDGGWSVWLLREPLAGIIVRDYAPPAVEVV